MKKDPKKGGVLQFGTEVVTGADGSIAGLLGASPGASTAVSIMLGLLQTCFPDRDRGVGAASARAHPELRRDSSIPGPNCAEEVLSETAETLALTA